MPENRVPERRDRPNFWLRKAVAAIPAPVSPGTFADFQRKRTSARLLHLNESPFPPSPRVADALRATIDYLNRYPDTMAVNLTTALSERTGVPADRIVVGSGSEELLKCIVDVTVGPHDEVIVPAPSFPLYEVIIRLRDGVAVRAMLDAQGANDPRTLLKALSSKTRVVFCCTPNPPTGGMMDKTALQTLVSGVPDELLLVVDEAYGEFARYASGPDVLSELDARTGPWVSMRTFSKAYGLAGLRVGYALCSSLEVAQSIRKAKATYSPSTISQAAALAALCDEEYLRKTVGLIRNEADRLSKSLESFGLKVYPTVANFVSAELPMAAKPVVEELRSAGIMVRDWRDREFPNQLRITVGRAEDTDALLRSLKEILLRRKETQS